MQEIGKLYPALKSNNSAVVKEGTGVEAGRYFVEVDKFNALTGEKEGVERKELTVELINSRIDHLQETIDGYSVLLSDLQLAQNAG